MLPVLRSVAHALVEASARRAAPVAGDGPRVTDLEALGAHVRRILSALLEGAARDDGYGPLDWHFDQVRGLYVARADWHRDARIPDDVALEKWGPWPVDWPALMAACSTGTALAAALYTDAGSYAKEKWGGSIVVALRGDEKRDKAPDPFLAPLARYVAEGSKGWWRTWTWRRLAAKGLPAFLVPAHEDQPVWGFAVYSGHVGTWLDCDRLHVVDPRTGDRCAGLWVLFWDGGFWDEAFDPGRKRWVAATKKTRARRWRHRRRYRYQPTRFESVETRAAREPRVTSRTFCLVGLRAPDRIPDKLRFRIEPHVAA